MTRAGELAQVGDRAVLLQRVHGPSVVGNRNASVVGSVERVNGRSRSVVAGPKHAGLAAPDGKSVRDGVRVLCRQRVGHERALGKTGHDDGATVGNLLDDRPETRLRCGERRPELLVVGSGNVHPLKAGPHAEEPLDQSELDRAGVSGKRTREVFGSCTPTVKTDDERGSFGRAVEEHRDDARGRTP